ncbi:hypothetical protein [Allocoleopsis sp.]|uniref:hypothetical protein n=1 Tax=Allocoleopsis sp. TaxID=3088169 RepID=UPI002FD4FDCF
MSYNYYQLRSVRHIRYTSIRQSDQADFAFNPFGAVAKIASVAPATRDAFRARRLLKAKGSSLPNQIRGSIQKGFGSYLEGIHTASLSGAGARSLYKGGRSAMRAVKNAAPNTNRLQKMTAGAKQGLTKGGASLRRSAAGATIDRLRSPLSAVVPSAVGDTVKIYKSIRPKGFKLPGTKRKIGSQIFAGIKRSGSILGVG